MSRYSTVRGDAIEYSMWLIFSDAGNVRLSRGTPDCGRAERAVQLNAKLPRSLFRTPQLKASISVEPAEFEPVTIDLEVARSALKESTGLDFDLRVVEPE